MSEQVWTQKTECSAQELLFLGDKVYELRMQVSILNISKSCHAVIYGSAMDPLGA